MRLWPVRILSFLGTAPDDCVLGGHFCHHFALFPPSPSVPEELVPWSLRYLGRMAPLAHSLVVELRVARALLFVMESSSWRDLEETVFCSDTSS